MNASRVWLITGAGRGLGRALTEAALAAGDSVIATVRGDHTLSPHDRLVVHLLDVRDRAGADTAIARAIDEFGRLDILVNNAGYGLIGAVEEVSEDDARAIIDTDLLGALWLSQAAIPVMRTQGGGQIVQVSTVGAVGTMPTLGLYNAAKWGLEGFSEALAAEVAGFGIRVTIAEFGEIDTDWAGSSMHFADPHPAYDELRTTLFGSPEVPWPATDEDTADDADSGTGTSAADAAAAILARVSDPTDERLRILVGDDAPGQVRAALDIRLADYARDPRFDA